MQPPVRRRRLVEQAVDDVDEALELTGVAGLLGELAQDRCLRRLAELEAAAGQRPDVADPDRRGDVAQEDAVVSSRHDGVGGDPRPVAARRHGASSAARNRGSRPRGGGHEVAHHETHRRTDVRSGGEPAGRVLERAGRARNAWTSHDTASLAANRRRIARS